ncbi:hypothetical protein K9L67_05430 [Candidatus Woesearchaeota archaeon]|nr:hypothetical protein [Candidatus Woesearchaeota archaeon]MCF7901640.1 hypothetical protein [Candidatus Woesearchaeota archaeon]MCF8013258.1 hypothetical protein [Candidatus Woesearchaeota archaeon]
MTQQTRIKSSKYPQIEEAFTTYKKIIQESIKKHQDKPIETRQEAINETIDQKFEELPTELTPEIIGTWYASAKEDRENILIKSLKERIEEIKQNTKGLEIKYSTQIIAKSSITGEIKNKIIPNLDQTYQKAKTLESKVIKYPETYIPTFLNNEKYIFNSNESEIELLESKNIITFERKRKIKSKNSWKDPFGINEMNEFFKDSIYIITSRVKKSKRELEKQVEILLGLRDDDFYDHIGYLESIPKKNFLKEINKALKKGKNGIIDFDYFPELIDPYNKKNLTNEQKQTLIHKIITQAEINAERIAKKALKKYTEIYYKEKEIGAQLNNYKNVLNSDEKKALVNYLKIISTTSGEKTESIFLTKKLFEFYTGVAGHHIYYIRQRDTDKKEKLLRYNLDKVAENIEKKLNPLYFI